MAALPACQRRTRANGLMARAETVPERPCRHALFTDRPCPRARGVDGSALVGPRPARPACGVASRHAGPAPAARARRRTLRQRRARDAPRCRRPWRWPRADPERPAVLPQAAADVLARHGGHAAVRRDAVRRPHGLDARRLADGRGAVFRAAPLARAARSRHRARRARHLPVLLHRRAVREPRHAGGRARQRGRAGAGAGARRTGRRTPVAALAADRLGAVRARRAGQGPDRLRAARARHRPLAVGARPLARHVQAAAPARAARLRPRRTAVVRAHAAPLCGLLRLLRGRAALPALRANELQQRAPVLVLRRRAACTHAALERVGAGRHAAALARATARVRPARVVGRGGAGLLLDPELQARRLRLAGRRPVVRAAGAGRRSAAGHGVALGDGRVRAAVRGHRRWVHGEVTALEPRRRARTGRANRARRSGGDGR